MDEIVINTTCKGADLIDITKLKDLQGSLKTLSWDQLPNEGIKAYRAFRYYLELGYKRSVPKVQALIGSKSKTYIFEWCAKYNWHDRVRAYEQDQARVKKEADTEAIKKMALAQVELASAYRKLLNIPISVLTQRLKPVDGKAPKAIADFENLDSVTLYEMIISSTNSLSTIVKVERLALGAPTDITKTETAYSNSDNPVQFGNIVAKNEQSTKLLTQFLNSIADSENSKSDNNGDAH